MEARDRIEAALRAAKIAAAILRVSDGKADLTLARLVARDVAQQVLDFEAFLDGVSRRTR